MDLDHVERPVVFFHGPACRDGWCAAWLAKKRWPDAELVPASYGDPVPDVRGRDVLVLDFSWQRDALLAMKAAARSVLVLDHHKTAQAELAGLDFCTFDMERSGAGLALDHFFPQAREWAQASLEAVGSAAPWVAWGRVALYCEDRDLWSWKLPNSREVNAALEVYPTTVEAWDALPAIPALATEGAAMLRFKQAEINGLAERAAPLALPEGTVLAVNTPLHQSEVGHLLAQRSPSRVALLWYRDTQGVFRCSLRSADDGPDVSEWARTRGGGGHAKAAGFESWTAP